jgi:protoheme IX farnesyltransferase
MVAGPESYIAPGAALPVAPATSFPAAFLLLTKPGIVLAEVVAGFAGILLACRGLSPATALVFWSLFTLLLAASGAAMGNGVLDAEADRLMPRLAARSRALAIVGKVRVLTIALLLMGGAFLLSALFLNSLALLLLATACGSYLLLYTRWLKRSSPWGVLAGAIPGALPPLIGAAAVSGSVAALPLLLGVIIFLWQLPHFWFLALHYRDQYQQAGIPVLALTHGSDLTKWLTLLCALALLPVTLAFLFLGSFSPVFAVITLLANILFPLCCYRYLFLTAEYRKGFIASLLYLTVILLAIMAESILTMH